MSIDNLLTPEQIQAAIEGANIGGSLKDGLVGPTTFTPSTHTPIKGYGTDLKPRIRDENDQPIEQRVTAPNVDRFNKQAAKRKLDELDALQKANKQKEVLSPEKLLAALNAQDRRIRKLEKQLKEQQQT